jgi:hypothetical protein
MTAASSNKKNGAVVREYVGYDRLEGAALKGRLTGVYRSLFPLRNFFMPTMKLESKVKAGSKEIKKYDEPHAPYQRLPESVALRPEVKAELTRLYGLSNPVQLQHTVNNAVLALREAVAVQSLPSGRSISPYSPYSLCPLWSSFLLCLILPWCQTSFPRYKKAAPP